MFTLNATDVINAETEVDDEVNFAFDGDNILAGIDYFGGLPRGTISAAIGPIWPAKLGNSVVRVLFMNRGVAERVVSLFKNGLTDADKITTFKIPAGGSAIFNGGSLHVYAANGVPAS